MPDAKIPDTKMPDCAGSGLGLRSRAGSDLLTLSCLLRYRLRALSCALAAVPAFALALMPAVAVAEGEAYGSLNPDEMSLGRMLEDAARGQTSMSVCASGYLMTKSGRHEAAREVFTRCAEQGYTGAMTWMSQLEDNGHGGPENPDAAADWDRRAAEAGDPVGMFNHGLDLMRGRGVAQDTVRGRALVDRAAAQGLPVAQRLQSAGYDLDEVTPDADNWKYAPLF